MVYELRIYHMHPDKMDAICNRFKDHTLKIFPRHGIKVTNFWVDAQGNDTIYYVCEFESKEARDKAWASFGKDPEWVEAKTKSEASGPIVKSIESYIMENVPFFSV